MRKRHNIKNHDYSNINFFYTKNSENKNLPVGMTQSIEKFIFETFIIDLMTNTLTSRQNDPWTRRESEGIVEYKEAKTLK